MNCAKRFVIQSSLTPQSLVPTQVRQLIEIYNLPCRFGDIVICRSSYRVGPETTIPVQFISTWMVGQNRTIIPIVDDSHHVPIIPKEYSTSLRNPRYFTAVWKQYKFWLQVTTIREQLLQNVQLSCVLPEIFRNDVLCTWAMMNGVKYFFVLDYSLERHRRLLNMEECLNGFKFFIHSNDTILTSIDSEHLCMGNQICKKCIETTENLKKREHILFWDG